MSRYIDAEWLEKLFPDTGEGEWTYNATALGYIDSAPTIEAVIMVRCKDCRYGTWDEDVEMYDCELHKGIFEAQHYCSDGERWEDAID